MTVIIPTLLDLGDAIWLSRDGISPKELIQYGRTRYRREECFMCRQLCGETGKVGPNLTSEGSRGRTEE